MINNSYIIQAGSYEEKKPKLTQQLFGIGILGLSSNNSKQKNQMPAYMKDTSNE